MSLDYTTRGSGGDYDDDDDVDDDDDDDDGDDDTNADDDDDDGDDDDSGGDNDYDYDDVFSYWISCFRVTLCVYVVFCLFTHRLARVASIQVRVTISYTQAANEIFCFFPSKHRLGNANMPNVLSIGLINYMSTGHWSTWACFVWLNKFWASYPEKMSQYLIVRYFVVLFTAW